jgi:cobalt-zinc-cadmium efflux system outer membrane protein
METTGEERRSCWFRATLVLWAVGLLSGCLGPVPHVPVESAAVTLFGNATSSSNFAGALSQPLAQEDAIRFALAHNPELQAARKRIDAAAARATQARLWSNPELEVTAEDAPVASDGLSRSQTLVGLSQTVPFPGKKSLDARMGRQAVTMAEWEYLGREIELVRDVKTAFIEVLAAEKKVGVSEQLVELTRSLVDAAGKRVAAGAAGDQERLRAEIELDLAKVEVSSARRNLTEARKTLGALMGAAREPIGPLKGELRETVELPGLEQACEQMLARHPNLRAAAVGKERAELDLRRAKLDPLPDVTLGVAGGRDLGAEESIMAFSISLPLPLFDRAQGRRREARAEAEIAGYDLTAVEQQLIRELSVVEARLCAAAEQVEAYRARILPKAEEALRLVRGGFEAGKFGFVDLVDIQRTLAQSRLAYYEKLSELNVAQAELEALVQKDLHAPPPVEPPDSKHKE